MTRTMILALALLATGPAFAGDKEHVGNNGDARHNDAIGNEGYDAEIGGKLQNELLDEKRQQQLDLWNGVIRDWLGGPSNESRASGGSMHSPSSNGGRATGPGGTIGGPV